MERKDWKERLGVVYSTNPTFNYQTDDVTEEDTLPKNKQLLRVALDKKHRGGKTVTLITGFQGKSEDLCALGKFLKVKCGTGGSAKDGEIMIQGDVRQKVTELMKQEGYGVKLIN